MLHAVGGLTGTQSGDTYTIDGSGLVSGTRKVNGKPLSADVSLTADDIGARANNWMPTAPETGAIPASEKGAAFGVATLDETGKVPTGQLPEMNYDPAGSAQTVQQTLNTHAANKTVHVTAAERQAWNNKAPRTHTHTAAQVTGTFQASQIPNLPANKITSGTLPVARGGTGISSLTGTDYTTSRVRGIALMDSVPSSIPNGCIVGVYEV